MTCFCLPTSTPATFKSMPSVAGLRPTATSRREPVTVWPSARRSVGPSVTFCTAAPARASTPDRSSTVDMIPDPPAPPW